MSDPVFICRSNAGYPASLEPRKVYVAIDDAVARARGLLRVIDESGEDYLYPSDLFVRVDLPEATRRALHLAA
ncbi:MAG: hypothetical protein ABI843_06565 [Dokdonella sp.]